MLKGHEVKTGDRIVAWSKEAHRYVAVTVWKVNASSCQGKDKNLELYKGLEYKQCWTVEAFQQQKPDDYNTLFSKKNATQSQQVSTDSQTGTGYNPSADSARLGDQQSGHDQQGDSGRNGLDLSDSPQQFQSFGATGGSEERTKKQGETLLSDGDFTVVDELEEPTTAKEIWEEKNASRSSNSTYVAESEPDSVGQDYNSDSTLSEPARLTSIVQVSSESDSQQLTTTETYKQSSITKDTDSTTLTSSQQVPSWIDPRSILTDAGTQSRAWEDSETIDDYAEKMLGGLWDWERQPLPVVFYDGENYYPGDCHHRVKAAIKAEQDSICVDVREGSLRDAIIYSCQANTDHGIPLRPRDQRRRIEMLLEQLAAMTAAERVALLDKVPGVKEQERAHCEKAGEWSSRVIARYLKLTSSGYVTVTNIQKEREFKRLVEELGLKEGDRFQCNGILCTIASLSPTAQKVSVHWGEGGIRSFSLDEFLTSFTSVEGEPENEVLKFNTQSEANQPDLLEELEEESGHKPPQLLPDKERNEGSPLALAREDGSQADTTELLLNQLMGQIGLLSDTQLQQLLIKAKAELSRRQEYRRSA